MTRYQIHNRTSGHILGVWEAESPDTALDAMAREAGYRDYADCQEQVPADDGEIVVTEMADDSDDDEDDNPHRYRPNNILIHHDRRPDYDERPAPGTVRQVTHGLRVTARYNYAPVGRSVFVPYVESWSDTAVNALRRPGAIVSLPDVPRLVEAVARLRARYGALPVQYNGPDHPDVPAEWSRTVLRHDQFATRED